MVNGKIEFIFSSCRDIKPWFAHQLSCRGRLQSRAPWKTLPSPPAASSFDREPIVFSRTPWPVHKTGPIGALKPANLFPNWSNFLILILLNRWALMFKFHLANSSFNFDGEAFLGLSNFRANQDCDTLVFTWFLHFHLSCISDFRRLPFQDCTAQFFKLQKKSESEQPSKDAHRKMSESPLTNSAPTSISHQ